MITLGVKLIHFKDDFTCLITISKCISVREYATKLKFTTLAFLVFGFVNWFATCTIYLSGKENEEQGVILFITGI